MVMTSVIVVADEQAELAQVVREAGELGLTDIETITGLGMIRGSIAEENIADLERMDTVKSVEFERAVTISPSDSSI